MTSLTMLCAAILLTAVAVWLEHDQRTQMMSIVRLLEVQMEHAQNRIARSDLDALLKAQAMWPLGRRYVEACFVRTFMSHDIANQNGLPFVHRRRRQQTVRHVLGTCASSCNRCGHTRLWTAMARSAGLFDRWIKMAEAPPIC